MRSTQTKRKLAGLLIVAIAAALLLPALAGAQQSSPSQDQYGSSLTQICVDTDGDGVGDTITTVDGDSGRTGIDGCTEDQPDGGGGGVVSSGGSGGLGGNVGPLPFTGFDVIAMAAVALAVTGLGLALQRAVSRDPGDTLS